MRSANDSLSATRSKPGTSLAPIAARPPPSPRPRRSAWIAAHVYPETLFVELRNPFEAPLQQLDLSRCRSLLRRKNGRCLEELRLDVTGDKEFRIRRASIGGEHIDGAEPAVSRGRAAHADEDLLRSGLGGGGHQLAQAGRTGPHGVVAARPADRGKPDRQRRFDDGDATRRVVGVVPEEPRHLNS